MKTLFLIVSTIIILTSIVPYIIDIIKGKTKPNIVSWITWSLLTGIATAAEIAAGEYVTAIFTGASTIETATVVLLGLKHGFVKYTRFDVTCQLATVVGIVLWQLYNSPSIAIIAMVAIDFIGALPTLRHGWLQPHEETWQTFALGSFAALLAVLALDSYTLAAMVFPVYLMLVNAATSTIIYGRGRQLKFAKVRE